MFNLISNSPLSDVLAPQVSPLEEFICQWNAFSLFFSPTNDASNELVKCRIESTNLTARLFKMADIVVSEQVSSNRRRRDTPLLSASMEHVLQNRILETLSVIAQTDTPLGICPHILIFFVRFLTDSKVELIPHKTVYTSLNKLILICGKIPAGPYEATEIYFLTTVVDLIHRNPALLNFFLEDSFPLVNALVSLLCSADAEIAKQAGDSIIKLMGILSDTSSQIVAEKTPFCTKVISLIINYYHEIPRSLSAQEIEMAIYAFRTNSSSNSSFTSSVRKFLSFLKWYIFFDMLIYHSSKESFLVNSLLSQFKQDFLDSFLLPDLIGEGFVDELDAVDNVFLTTLLLSNCLRNTESLMLFNFICNFLLLDDSTEKVLPLLANNQKSYELNRILFKRCNLCNTLNGVAEEHRSKTIKLSSATLQLFEDILSRPSQAIVDYLIVKHLKSYQYREEQEENQFEPLENTDQICNKFNSLSVLDEMQNVATEIDQLSNISNYNYLEFADLNNILFYFTSLIPNELKLNATNERLDYEAYLKEAVKGFHLLVVSCYVHWQDGQDTTVTQSKTDANNEGPFIEVIFNNLSSMFTLPYEINIQTFSILAKISLIPNKYIDEYFLNPTIPLKNECRSLFSILHKMVEDLQIHVKGIDCLQEKLLLTKKLLLGEAVELESSYEQYSKTLQSVIVIDEFCKEMASVIYAKNYILKLCHEKATQKVPNTVITAVQ